MNAIRTILLWLALILAGTHSAIALTASENRVWQIFSTVYDAPVAEATTGYDSLVRLTPSYDEAQIHSTGGETRSAEAERAFSGQNAEFKAAEGGGATVGKALSNDYRSTFFEANPDLEGQVVVHHAVEQQVLTRYPGLFDESEIHSLENLRGIPNELNSDLHLSQIRRDWNQFYRSTPNPTREQILQRATDIDSKFGSQFSPPVGQ